MDRCECNYPRKHYIKSGSVIAAGSIISKKYRVKALIGGNPGKVDKKDRLTLTKNKIYKAAIAGFGIVGKRRYKCIQANKNLEVIELVTKSSKRNLCVKTI